MGLLCDFCGEQRSMVYCRSDAACLCLSCDRNVHSANALSRRHLRTLLCDRCMTQPAIVRCMEDNVSLCQNCDRNGYGGSASGHKRQTINCYSGCPSASELSGIWSFILEFPRIADSNCEQGMGLMSINENSVSNFWGAPENSSTRDIASAGKMNDLETANKLNPWIGSSSTSAVNPMLRGADQAEGSVDSTTRKVNENFEIPINYQLNDEYVCDCCHLDVIVLFCVLFNAEIYHDLQMCASSAKLFGNHLLLKVTAFSLFFCTSQLICLFVGLYVCTCVCLLVHLMYVIACLCV